MPDCIYPMPSSGAGLAGSSDVDTLLREWDLSWDENQGRLRPKGQGVPSSGVSSLHWKLLGVGSIGGPRVAMRLGPGVLQLSSGDG